MLNFARVGFLVLALSACSEPKTADSVEGKSGAFTYAPALDKPYRETNRRFEEVSIPGSPLRDATEWTLDWDVVVTKETNLFKRSLKLVGLKLNVNGVELLKGDEVQKADAVVEILTDKDSKVVDVRGADKLSAAIVSLGAPDAQKTLAVMFSPDKMKLLATVRSIELHEDFVGKPTEVGSEWSAQDSSGTTKKIRVVGQAPCDASQCVQVLREQQVDKKALVAEVSDFVGRYVRDQGGDPSAVEVVGVDTKVEDSLLIDPSTMNYHGAKFINQATLRVASPRGEISVAFKVDRQSSFRY